MWRPTNVTPCSPAMPCASIRGCLPEGRYHMTAHPPTTAGRDQATFVISITPFDEEERLDEAALHRHFRRLADSGIGVYVGGGGSGEGFTLNPEEARKVLHIAAEELK